MFHSIHRREILILDYSNSLNYVLVYEIFDFSALSPKSTFQIH